MKNSNFITSLLFLVLVDLIPLFGTWRLGWEINTVLIYYWTENTIFVLWLFAKAIFQKNYVFLGGLIFFSSFILLLINLFWYFDFATVDFGSWVVDKTDNSFSVRADTVFLKIVDWFKSNQVQVFIAIISYPVSQCYSFFQNYLKKEEFKTTSLPKNVVWGYGSYMLFFLCFGLYVQFPLTMLWVFFIICKTIIDVVGHLFKYDALEISASTINLKNNFILKK